MTQRLISLVLSETNPSHELLIAWFDSLPSNARGKIYSKHIENALIDYVKKQSKVNQVASKTPVKRQSKKALDSTESTKKAVLDQAIALETPMQYEEKETPKPDEKPIISNKFKSSVSQMAF